MNATTLDGLVSFKGYLAKKTDKNTGQPPYTIKAADLDNNFQRVVCRDSDKLQVVRSSDGQTVEAGPLITFKRNPHGQVPTPSVLTLDVIVDGKFRQMAIIGELIPEN